MSRNVILQVDVQGCPQDWLTLEEAAGLICADRVAWSAGRDVHVLQGGISRMTGELSQLPIPAVIATTGSSRINLADSTPPLGASNNKLFARDFHMCAYCGEQFNYRLLSRDHIVPVSQGGDDDWMNVVTSCKRCNHAKGAKSLKEYGKELLYVPYAPNWFEGFILARGGKRVLADQMEFLLARVGHNSRLRTLKTKQ